MFTTKEIINKKMRLKIKWYKIKLSLNKCRERRKKLFLSLKKCCALNKSHVSTRKKEESSFQFSFIKQFKLSGFPWKSVFPWERKTDERGRKREKENWEEERQFSSHSIHNFFHLEPTATKNIFCSV